MRVRPLSCVGLLVAISCGGEPYPSPPGGTGGSAATTGGSTGGSTPAATGGTTGGTTNTTGGTLPTTGGTTGGSGPATGGSVTTTGGVFGTGGSSKGGSATGGKTSGGTNSGGFGKGGSNTGGSNAGGSNTGGSSKGGGGAGGASSTGGSGGGSGTPTFASLCASCHGQNGEGMKGLGPEIQHPVRDFATWVVRNGRQGHPSFPNSVMAAFPQSALSDATLTSFFDALSTPTIPKPTTGAALYADYCGTCHGAGGAGGPAGHNAKGQPLSKAISMVRSGHSLTQFSSRTGYMPKWSTAELSDAEVGLIVTYLDSQ